MSKSRLTIHGLQSLDHVSVWFYTVGEKHYISTLLYINILLSFPLVFELIEVWRTWDLYWMKRVPDSLSSNQTFQPNRSKVETEVTERGRTRVDSSRSSEFLSVHSHLTTPTCVKRSEVLRGLTQWSQVRTTKIRPTPKVPNTLHLNFPLRTKGKSRRSESPPFLFPCRRLHPTTQRVRRDRNHARHNYWCSTVASNFTLRCLNEGTRVHSDTISKVWTLNSPINSVRQVKCLLL